MMMKMSAINDRKRKDENTEILIYTIFEKKRKLNCLIGKNAYGDVSCLSLPAGKFFYFFRIAIPKWLLLVRISDRTFSEDKTNAAFIIRKIFLKIFLKNRVRFCWLILNK